MSASPAIVEYIRRAGGAERFLAALTGEQRQGLMYDWKLWGRPLEKKGPREYTGQFFPSTDWLVALILCGRGWGKTRTGAESAIDWARDFPRCRIALVGATAKEVREVMWDGESGLKARSAPWFMPRFNVTDQAIEWPNGSIAYLYSADAPDILRGPQHHFAWCDEMAKWRRLQNAWNNLSMGLRLGKRPRCIITTTPRPLGLLRQLQRRATTITIRGGTYDNAANLPVSFLEEMKDMYGGTTLGQQELEGVLFDEMPGALWARAWFDTTRIQWSERDPDRTLKMIEQLTGSPIERVVVSIDPATTSDEESDECGITVQGIGAAPMMAKDERSHVYVLDDATHRASPDAWARRAVRLHHAWGADAIVAETNLGGETIASLIHLIDPDIKVIEKGGNRGKKTRAEPVAAVYEQKRVHHVGIFGKMEDQMCSFTLDTVKSPNNMDACVHGVGELLFGGVGYV